MYTTKRNRNHNATTLFGVILASAGLLFLLRQFNVLNFRIDIWPLFLIAAGVLNGMKHGFVRTIPLAFIILGVFFLIPDFTIMNVSSKRLFWPVMLIIGGIYIALKARDRDERIKSMKEELSKQMDIENLDSINESNFVNIEAYFGGRKEFVTSKQFSGCNATAICGGAEINLLQADNTLQPMVLDVRVIFGGIELVVPSHWEIVNDADVFFGGIEDKRTLRTTNDNSSPMKTLVIRGSVSFGGLEIKSF